MYRPWIRLLKRLAEFWGEGNIEVRRKVTMLFEVSRKKTIFGNFCNSPESIHCRAASLGSIRMTGNTDFIDFSRALDKGFSYLVHYRLATFQKLFCTSSHVGLTSHIKLCENRFARIFLRVHFWHHSGKRGAKVLLRKMVDFAAVPRARKCLEGSDGKPSFHSGMLIC